VGSTVPSIRAIANLIAVENSLKVATTALNSLLKAVKTRAQHRVSVDIAKLSPGASSIKAQFVVCSNTAKTLILSFPHCGNFG
jgi:intracellular sulfur oxidation DsrE/DsrF family protein